MTVRGARTSIIFPPVSRMSYGHPSGLLVAHPQHQIQTITQEEQVGHPPGDQRRQGSATTERDRDRMCRPIAEADREGLSNADCRTAPSDTAPAQTQRNADEDHDDRDKRERDSTVVVGLQSCGLGALLMPASGIGPDIMESHQFGIASDPGREVIGDEGQGNSFLVERSGSYGPVGRKTSMPALI